MGAIASVVALAALTVGVPAVGQGELSGSITFLHKYGDPRYAPYFDAVAASYMAANPGVTIEVQAETDQGVKDKLRVLAASGSLPDVYFSWAGDFTKKFVRGGMAKDLTADVTGDWQASFAPAALEAYTYDGALYGVPITLDAKYLAYNTQLLADNGVAIPTTLEELLASCDTFRSKGFADPIAFGNQYGWPAIHYMTQLNAFNVPAAVRDVDYEPETGAFTDPGYLVALEQFAEINARCLTPGSNGISHESGLAQFMADRSPMFYLEAVEFFNFTEAYGATPEFAAAWDFIRLPAPAAPTGDVGYLTGAPDGFLVNAASAHVDIALDFLKHLTSLENASKLVAELGWLSPVEGSATPENTFPGNVKVLEDLATADGFAVWLDTVTHIDVANAYLNGVQALLDGTKQPADVVADVQAAAETARTATE
jgi:raffinose/stachyose/melibiose transport system substrate-binding protein